MAALQDVLHLMGTSALPSDISHCAERAAALRREGSRHHDYIRDLEATVSASREELMLRVPGSEEAIDHLIRAARACGEFPNSLRTKDGRVVAGERKAALEYVRSLVKEQNPNPFRIHED